MADLDEILSILPHAFPFRMIDRIIEVEKGRRAIAVKNVSADEPYFAGPLPKEPVLPGVFIVEAMAQTGGLALQWSSEMGGVAVLARIEEFRLKKKVIPGDRMIIEAEVLQVFSGMAKLKVMARVEGELVAEGTFIVAKTSSSKIL